MFTKRIHLRARIALTSTAAILFVGAWSPTIKAEEDPIIPAAGGDPSEVKSAYLKSGDSSIELTQRREVTKSGRIEAGLLSGMTFTDPFLESYPIGLSMGYFLNEIMAVRVLAWRYAVGPSDAQKYFLSESKTLTNSNPPYNFLGAEFDYNFIYGKLSLLDWVIKYTDIFGLAGFGRVSTETGAYFSPLIGMGQRLYFSNNFSMDLTYRLITYQENLPKRSSRIYTKERTNFSHSIMVGVSALLL